MITIRTRCEERKEMAGKLAAFLGTRAIYMRAPTYAFQIGDVIVNRDATVTCGQAEARKISQWLYENGYSEDVLKLTDDEINAACEADEITGDPQAQTGTAYVSIFESDWTVDSLKNFVRMLYTRQTLINAMLKADVLFVDDEVIDILRERTFETAAELEQMITAEANIGMIRGVRIESDVLRMDMDYDTERPKLKGHYAEFIRAFIKLSKECNRTKAVRMSGQIRKYDANVFLSRLGFGGPEYKDLRRTFMGHLSGYAAFKSDDRMQAHKDKLAEQRRIRRELNEEAHEND